jgi:hypothetical protein
MIMPLPSPDNHDITVWSAQCDRCYIVKPLDSVDDWLLTREAVDRHYCKPCTATVARSLIDSAAPRRRVPLVFLVGALVGIGVLARKAGS